MGLATARLLGRDHHVVICDVQQERLDAAAEELRALGTSCDATVCDVTERAAVERARDLATATGTVVSVVHTAGLSPTMASAERIIQVNALGTVYVNEVFSATAEAGFRLVNVASSAGHLPPGTPVPRRAYPSAFTDPDRLARAMVSRCNLLPAKHRAAFAYSISKHFVIWYSRKQAAALGAKGGRIVSVSPGSTDTEMGRLEGPMGATALAEVSAVGRFGRPEEIAEVLAFCASEKASYLTGTDVLVDGGAGAALSLRGMVNMARSL
jgi:NAD(P)-dependent dehydrogenase (short-subunit alcohol dehydrogenase family)